MQRTTVLTAAALAGVALLAGCGQKQAQQGAAPDQTNQPVNAAQDAASAPVGAGTAALGSVTKDVFIRDAAMSDMYEIAAAKLALMRTKSPDIKKLANMMIHDHTESSDKLKGLITSGKVQGTLPTELDQRRMGLLDNLRGATDADFDNRYLEQQSDAHTEMKLLMDGYQSAGQDDALKMFAAEVAPVVQMHLDMVNQLKDAHKGETGSNAAAGGAVSGNTTGR
jgi:putative membrane protein